MPIFDVKGKTLQPVKLINFKLEKELQSLVEQNLETMFNCKFVGLELRHHNLRVENIFRTSRCRKKNVKKNPNS